MGLFHKKLQVGEGQKYDLTKVSTENLSQKDVAKNNKKLIDIFNAYSKRDGNAGELSQVDLANLMYDLQQIDLNNDKDKLTQKELKKLAKSDAFKGYDVKASDLRELIKNIANATKGKKTDSVDNVIKQQQKLMEQLEADAKRNQLDNAAKQFGLVPTNTDGIYYSKEQDLYFKYVEDKGFGPAIWNNETSSYELMTEEQAEAKKSELATKQKQVEQQPKEEVKQKELYNYVVQPNDKFTDIIKKSLQASGIENPTKEQIAEAKEQFKKDNPNAVRTTKNGYEFLNVGAEVKLQGQVAFDKNAKEAEAAWAKEHVNVGEEKQSPVAGEDASTPVAKKSTNKSNNLGEVVVTAKAPTVDQKAKANKIAKAAEKAGVTHSGVQGYYQKMNGDGTFTYWVYDDSIGTFTEAKDVISVTPEKHGSTQSIVRKINDKGGYTDFVYDAKENGRVVKEFIKDANGNSLGRIEYDYSGENTFDSLDRDTYNEKNQLIHSVTTSASSGEPIYENQYKYNEQGKRIQYITKYENAEMNKIADYTYNSDGSYKVTEKDLHGNVTFQSIYNKDNLPTRFIGEDNSTSDFEYHKNGELSKAVDKTADGKLECIEYYNSDKKVTRKTDYKDGKISEITDYVYNAKGEVTKIVKRDGANWVISETVNTYDENNNMTSVVTEYDKGKVVKQYNV